MWTIDIDQDDNDDRKYVCGYIYRDEFGNPSSRVCSYKAKLKANLRVHLQNIHGIGEEVQKFCCDQPNCNFQTKYKYCYQQHRLNLHGISDYKSKNYKFHKIEWYACDQILSSGKKCAFVTKYSQSLKKHFATKHNLNREFINPDDYKTDAL